jgi:hypothetical protein
LYIVVATEETAHFAEVEVVTKNVLVGNTKLFCVISMKNKHVIYIPQVMKFFSPSCVEGSTLE